MYSSDEHSTFELSWFLSHQEVMEHKFESCKHGKGVIAAHPFTNKSTKIITIMDMMQESTLSFSGSCFLVVSCFQASILSWINEGGFRKIIISTYL